MRTRTHRDKREKLYCTTAVRACDQRRLSELTFCMRQQRRKPGELQTCASEGYGYRRGAAKCARRRPIRESSAAATPRGSRSGKRLRRRALFRSCVSPHWQDPDYHYQRFFTTVHKRAFFLTSIRKVAALTAR